jgi:nucleoside-diphosphate-sugar epimerase
MRILVTGGSGTIGAYILRELQTYDHKVTCYSRSTPPLLAGADYVAGDIMDQYALTRACEGTQAIVHLAAVPGPRRAPPAELMTVNVIGTVNVLEAAIVHRIPKVVFASSGAAAGFTFQNHPMIPRYLPIDEDHPDAPQDDYGLSKLLAELTCRRYTDNYGLSTICLRINNNWYLDREGAAMAVRCGWAKGLSIEELWTVRYRRTIEDAEQDWPRPGPPSPRSNLWAVTDARDAAQAFRLAIEDTRLMHEVFYINSDDTCSLQPSQALVERHFPHVPLQVALTGYMSLVSHAKASRLLGYRPKFTWRDSDFSRWLDQSRS